MVQTDRLTEFISECALKDLSNDIWHTYQSRKLVGDEENNIPPRYTKFYDEAGCLLSSNGLQFTRFSGGKITTILHSLSALARHSWKMKKKKKLSIIEKLLKKNTDYPERCRRGKREWLAISNGAGVRSPEQKMRDNSVLSASPVKTANDNQIQLRHQRVHILHTKQHSFIYLMASIALFDGINSIIWWHH